MAITAHGQAPDTGTAAQVGMFTKGMGTSFKAFYPNVLPKLWDKYGQQFSSDLAFLMAMTGRFEPIDSQELHVYETNRYHTTITATTAATFTAAAINTPVVVYIANDYYVRPGVIISLTNNNLCPAKVFSVYDSAGQTIDTSKGSTVMPTYPITRINVLLQNTDYVANNGNVTVAQGQVLPITGNQWADGTMQPLPAVSGVSKRSFYPSWIKETIGILGTEMVTGTWWDDHATYWKNMVVQCDYRQSLAIGNALLFGQTTDQTGALAGEISGQGLIPDVLQYGATSPYTAGALSLTDFFEDQIYLQQQGVETPVVVALCGDYYHKYFTDACPQLPGGKSGAKILGEGLIGPLGKIFSNMDPKSNNKEGIEQMAVDFNFTVAQMYRFTYIVKIQSGFLNPVTYGAPGMVIPYSALLFPVKTINDAKNHNLKFANVAIRPLAKNGYDRFMEIWHEGAAGGDTEHYTGETDRMTYFMRSNFMLQTLGTNEMIYKYVE